MGFFVGSLGSTAQPLTLMSTANHALTPQAGTSSPAHLPARFAGGSPSKVLMAAIAGFFAWRALSYLPKLDLQVGNIDLNVYNAVGFLILYTGVWGLVKVLLNLYPLGIITDYANFL